MNTNHIRINMLPKMLLISMLPLVIFLSVAIGIWWFVTNQITSTYQVIQANNIESNNAKQLRREFYRWDDALRAAMTALNKHQTKSLFQPLNEAQQAEAAVFRSLQSLSGIPGTIRTQIRQDLNQYSAYSRSLVKAIDTNNLSRAEEVQLAQNQQIVDALIKHLDLLDQNTDARSTNTVIAMTNSISRLRIQVPAIGIVAVLFAAFVAWQMASATYRRLLKLANSIESVAKGNRVLTPEQKDFSPGIWRHDELWDAQHAFEQMLHALTQAERQMNDELSFRQGLLDALPIPIFMKEPHGLYTLVNTSFEAFFGSRAEDLIGKSVYDINPKPLADIYFEKDRELFDHPGVQIYETQVKDAHGDLHHVVFHKATILSQEQLPIGLIGGILDITNQKEAEKKIHHLAFYDTLTDLPNRALFMDRVGQAVPYAERHHQTFALFFMDLDHFKDVNDTLGHDVGDLLLIEVAHRIQSAIRDQDTVCRMGGDEFIFLLLETHREGAIVIAQKILSQAAKPYYLGEYQISVTASIGIALYPEHGRDFTTLSKKADISMYTSKSAGGNVFHVYDTSMEN